MIEEFSGQFIKLKNNCLKLHLFQDKTIAIIALSGGVDSICALYFLLWLKERKVYDDLIIIAAHLNHSIREEALSEQKFVENLCEQLNIKCHVKTVDVPSLADKRRSGIEEAGRFARYEFFRELKQAYETKSEFQKYQINIVLGQHQDDLAETVIMNLGRGSGIAGMTTLKAKENELRRPLLILSKSEIYDLGKAQNWQWVEDQSNQSNDYLRNRIRHDLIPHWNQILGYDVRPLLARLSNNLEADADALNWMNKKSYDYCIIDQNQLLLKRLKELPKTILKAVLEIWLKENGFQNKTITAIQMEQIWPVIQGEQGNKILKIGDGINFKRIKNRLIFESLNSDKTNIL